jgi:DNA-binding response OmpR family regulator
MDLKLLFVEDQEIRNDLVEFFNKSEILGHTIIADMAETFELGIEKIKTINYDLIILDLCKGEPAEDAEREGLAVLKQIQSYSFIPVIFYTGIAHSIMELQSEVVGVVNKSDGLKVLQEEIERIISSNIALLKHKILSHVNDELRNYFWDIIDKQKEIFKPSTTDYSLGYLMLRRLSDSLSKENIKKLLGDNKINEDKSHPMEFYIYPTADGDYEAGEILTKDGIYYAVLTPSCDFIEDEKIHRMRSVGRVLLVVAIPLVDNDYYKDYKRTNNRTNRDRLAKLIETRKGDQYFFLPGTPFMENLVLNFQNKIMVDYSELKSFERLAKLDDPFAQSMVASFIRYYNRIGFPDIDSNYVIDNL